MRTESDELSGNRGPLRFLPAAITIALCALIAHRFDGYDLLARVELPYLFAALAIALVLDTTVGAFKWWRVTLACDIPARFAEIWHLWVGLIPAVFFAPFQSGHLLYALALKNHKQLTTFAALECVAYDKALTLVGTVVLVALGQLIAPADHPFHHPLIALACLGLLAAFLGKRVLLRYARRIPVVERHSRLLQRPVAPTRELGLVALATVYQSSDLLAAYLACRGLGLPMEPEVLFGVFPLVLLLSYLPVSISGLGVRENLLAVVLATSLTYDQAVAAGLFVDLTEYVWPALLGLPWLPRVLRTLWPTTQKKPRNAMRAS